MNEKPLKVDSFEVYFDHAIEDRELICELAKHSSVLYGLFVDLIRQFYMNGDGFIKGCPVKKFDYDKNKTQIWIDKEMRWNDEHPEFRPAIYVKLSPIQYTYPTGRVPYAVDERTGTRYDLRHGVGQVTFVHIAKTSGESNILCDNTASYLWRFAQAIKKDYCFIAFKPSNVTPIQKAPDGSKEHWISTCTFDFEFGEATGIRPEAPVLQEIKVVPLQNKIPSDILRTDLDKPRQGQGV